MNRPRAYDTLDDPAELARFGGWSEAVYRDFAALAHGELSRDDFDRRYLRIQAVMVLDLTGFTAAAMEQGALDSLIRIFDARRLCIPVLVERGASFVRAFADDLVAVFDTPEPGVDAAFEIHERLTAWGAARDKAASPEACIGLGFGPMYGIGANRAMGLEMNLASKLGEDTARGGETLVTDGAHAQLASRSDLYFERCRAEETGYSYYRVARR